MKAKTLAIKQDLFRNVIFPALLVLTLILCGTTAVESKESISFQHELYGEMKMPIDVAVSQLGEVFVLDQKQSQVHVFSEGGEWMYSFADYGSGPGKLMNPESIALNLNDEVIIADTGNKRVQVFSKEGRFIYELGSSGEKPGQFNKPTNVAVDQYGYIFVMDVGNQNISKFSPKGVYYQSLPLNGEPQDMVFDVQQNLYILHATDGHIVKWMLDTGSSEIIEYNWEGREFMSEAAGMTVDMRGDIYLVDHETSRVVKIDQEQNLLLSFGSKGDGKGQFLKPAGITADQHGKVYIADSRNKRVQVIDVKGSYKPTLASWAGQPPVVDYLESIPVEESIVDLKYKPNYGLFALSEESGHITHKRMDEKYQYGEFEDRALSFARPQAMDILMDGRMLVADTGNHRLQFINPDGSHNYLFGTRGSDDGQFDSLQGVAVRDDGFIFIADTKNNRIQVFNSDGIYMESFGVKGEADKEGIAELGWFHHPKSLEFDSTGMLYVLDSRNKRIQVFDRDGQPVKEISEIASGIEMENPVDIAIDEKDYLYIADRGTHTIKVLNPFGDFVTEFGSAGKGRSYFPKLSSVSAAEGKIYVADYNLDEIKVFDIYPDASNYAGNVPSLPVETPAVEMAMAEEPMTEEATAKKSWISIGANSAEAMPELPVQPVESEQMASTPEQPIPEEAPADMAAQEPVQDPQRLYFTQVSYPIKTDNMDIEVKKEMTRKMTLQLVISNVAEKYGMSMKDVEKLIQIEKEDLLEDGRMKITVSVPKEMNI